MKSKFALASLFSLAAFLVLQPATPTQAEPASDAAVKRGKYIVENVAMCADCHTPRDDKGQYDMSAWLQGNVLDFKPTVPMPFAVFAPPIAGLPTYTNDVLAVRFLETGTNAAGKMAMPPMPQFRLNHEDATAVVAYLRSLKK